MPRIRLLHWNAAEAATIIDLLTRAKHRVDYDQAFDSATLRTCREHPPSAVVISLARLPSHGREWAIALRQSPKTSHIPIVFCGGPPDKVNLIREILPDANYCTEVTLIKTLQTIKPVESPAKPTDMMNRYGQRTTPQKLGITDGRTVVAINPPRNLNELIPGVEFVEQGAAVTLCFVRSPDDLRADMSRVRKMATKTKLWFVGRKKSSPGS